MKFRFNAGLKITQSFCCYSIYLNCTVCLLLIVAIITKVLYNVHSWKSFNNSSVLRQSFDMNTQDIVVAIVATVAVNAPIALELILDVLFKWKCGINDHNERLQMILSVIIPVIIVLQIDISFRPFIFCFAQVIQYVGCFHAILSLCHKLVPRYFTRQKTHCIQLLIGLSGSFAITALNRSVFYFANILFFISVSISLGIFFLISIQFIRSLDLNFVRLSIDCTRKVSINEISCLLYILCTFIILFLIPGIAAATVAFQWKEFNLPIILISIYSTTAFSLFPSCIPGRIARYLYTIQISKRVALRYLSHEIRSPINVVHNGIMFVTQDLTDCDDSLKEYLDDIRQASIAAVSVLDDFQNFDKLESGTLPVLLKCVSIDNFISTIVQPLSMFGREKKIKFIIDNQIDATIMNSGELHVDKNKMSQVFRNLIINSVKSTPKNGAITVIFKVEKISNIVIVNPDHSGMNSGKFGGMLNGRRIVSSKVQAVEEESDRDTIAPMAAKYNVIIEVTDTGSGVPEHLRQKILGRSFQFDPEKLQGGGSIGLELWICHEILRLHHGTMSIDTGAAGIGTNIALTMPLQSLSSPASERRMALQNTPNLGNRLSEVCDHRPSNCSSQSQDQGHSQQKTLRISSINEFEERLRPPIEAAIRQLSEEFDNPNFTTSPLALTSPTSGPPPASSPLSLHILIVDDSELNRRMVRRSIQRSLPDVMATSSEVSLQFEEADDGVSAVEAVRKSMLPGGQAFHIIFMDNIMLRMNGTEAAQSIREMGYPGRIIGVTGNTLPTDVADFLQHGADQILAKPVDLSQLKEIIAKKIKNLEDVFQFDVML